MRKELKGSQNSENLPELSRAFPCWSEGPCECVARQSEAFGEGVGRLMEAPPPPLKSVRVTEKSPPTTDPLKLAVVGTVVNYNRCTKTVSSEEL